jgi:hypothetical protein
MPDEVKGRLADVLEAHARFGTPDQVARVISIRPRRRA